VTIRTETRTILVSGWRFLPHSYALVNQFQLLEMLKRAELRVFHEDVPYFGEHWKKTVGLFPAAAEQALGEITRLPLKAKADAELRISFPYDIISPQRADRTCVFGTAEYGAVSADCIVGAVPLAQAHREAAEVVLVTPSNWSRDGLIRSGANPHRLEVVPHGVEPGIFRPPTSTERAAARTRLGLSGSDAEFIFFNAGAMTGNKGLPLLLSAFAQVIKRYPTARLILKGLDSLYPSKHLLKSHVATLTTEDAELLVRRITYVGDSLSLSAMASLYQLSDCYVSPYYAEGFNMPVLESIACGLPVICTSGGPTDDFTLPEFALRIESKLEAVEYGPNQHGVMMNPSYDSLVQQMLYVIEDAEYRRRAREAGPAFVLGNFTWQHVVDRLLQVLLPNYR
jgi:glycosyltransferase involved in cell wall biosynthesis